MTSPGFALERTALAFRRTLLGLVLNAGLLMRLPPLGAITGSIVLAAAALGYLAALRAAARPWLGVALVAGAGCLDAVTMLVSHR
jgi:hypothetical protein